MIKEENTLINIAICDDDLVFASKIEAMLLQISKKQMIKLNIESSPNLCVNSSFSYVVLSTLLLSSRDLIEWSLVCHSILSYQKFCD